MNQVIAFQAPGDPTPIAVPVSAQNPLPVIFVDAPVGAAVRAGVRSQVVAFRGADGEALQVPVSESNPLPVSL